jgi:hypothetical protein
MRCRIGDPDRVRHAMFEMVMARSRDLVVQFAY